MINRYFRLLISQKERIRMCIALQCVFRGSRQVYGDWGNTTGREVKTRDHPQEGDSATLRYTHAILTLFLAAVRPDNTPQHCVQWSWKKQVPDSLKSCSCFPPKICPQDILLSALSTSESAFVYMLFWATLKSFEHRATKIWEKFKHWIIGGNSKLNLCLFSFAFRPKPFALVFL